MPLVREIFWLSVKYDFTLRAVFLAGTDNVLADRISRLDVLENANEAWYILSGMTGCEVSCENHMSNETFLSLQGRWIEGSLSCR